MKPRKIVQVALLQESERCRATLYVAADDGTAWFRSLDWSERDPWFQIPPLPPIEEPEGEEGG